ncbi:Flavodoxin [Ruminococcus flavefaciens]|uniref:Flavodoxin n=1 Tax=Ruminococcus flavefaciens TaxID=1265 RepID=A0A1H6L6G3_RUMFL|nr:flavodoxin [Ruminococcus flavefaciens]SEH83907.1 Flavodoxin [Ruminococcus flavefaciens]
MPERKFLTVFFSWGGHTRKTAKMIAKTTSGDLFELKPEKAYSKIYPICAAQAKKERDKDTRPPYVGGIADISQYTDIVIGYPAWWYTCPMIVLSFLEQYDLTGKNVYIFNTHGGSGSVGTDDIKKLCKGNVHKSIDGNHLTEADVREWLNL